MPRLLTLVFALVIAQPSFAKSHPEFLELQVAPVVALAPNGVFTVFSTAIDLRGAIVKSDGDVEASFPIGIGPAGRAAVASSRSAHLVAWTVPGGTLLIRRFTLEGEAIDPQPVVVTSDVCESPGVGSDGEQFVIAWSRCGGSTPSLISATVSATGAIGPANVVVAPSDAHRIIPGNPVFGESEYLLPWISFDGYQPYICDPYCPIVSSHVAPLRLDGTRRDNVDTLVVMQPGEWTPARVVWDGNRFALAWRAGDYYTPEIDAATWENDALGPIRVFARATSFEYYSRTIGPLDFTWDGAAYIAVWAEWANRDDRPSDLMLARRTPAQLESSEPVPILRIAGSADREWAPSIAKTSNERIAIAYEIGPYDGAHVMVRFLDFSAGDRRRSARR